MGKFENSLITKLLPIMLNVILNISLIVVHSLLDCKIQMFGRAKLVF